MKLLRFFAKALLSIAVIIALAASVAMIPDLQTWWVQRELARHPEFHLSVGSVSAHFGKVELQDVRWDHAGSVLTVPLLEARLPLIAAVLDRKFFFESLVAKGWTLDLHPLPEELDTASTAEASSPGDASAPGRPTVTPAAPASTSAPNAAPADSVFKGVLSGWKLPCDVSAKGIEWEGDVIVPLAEGKARAPVHVVITGGGLEAGKPGTLVIDAGGTFIKPEIMDLSSHGTLTVGMDTPRSVGRLEWKSLVSAKGDTFSGGSASLAVVLSATRAAGEETDTIDVAQDDRHLVAVLARLKQEKAQLEGTWKLDLRSSDVAAFFAGHPLSAAAVAGEGNFDSATSFARLHALGRLSVRFTPSKGRAPLWDLLGNEPVDTRFDATQTGTSIRVDQWSGSLGGAQPWATAQALQAFTIDLTTGGMTAANPSQDWLAGSFRGFPLSSLSELPGGLHFTSGAMTGDWVVRSSNDGYTLRSNGPFTASNVAIESAGKIVARDLDLSVALAGRQNSEGWQLQASPLTVDRGGHPIATLEAQASRSAKANSPLVLTGKAKADLQSLSAQPGLSGLREISAHSASGDFSATMGARTKVEGNLTVVQQDEAHTLALKLSAEMGIDQAITFRAPLKVTSGSDVLELTTEGSWLDTRGAHQISLRIAGKDVDLDRLRLLGPPLAMITGQSSAARAPHSLDEPPPTPALRDKTPFWGQIVGRVSIAFDKFKSGDADFDEVRGTFKFSPGSIQLETGQFQIAGAPLPASSTGKDPAAPVHAWLGAAEGALTFDPVAEIPYRLKGMLDHGEIDAASVFPTPPVGEDPPFHGHFSIASTVEGSGANLSDLVAHTQQEFRMKSTGGIVRLLKTHLTGLTQTKETAAGNVADTVGTMMGKLAGIQKNSTGLGKIRLSKTTEAVLNFSYQAGEMGYTEITLTATRGSDGDLHLAEFSMITPDAHVTGGGQITSVKGLSPAAEPLSVDLKFAVRDQTAELLANTGLLSPEKDNLGYTVFKQVVHFGGTLQHPDVTQWHDLLFDAATRKPAPEPAKRP